MSRPRVFSAGQIQKRITNTGASMVEAALVLPIYILIVLFVIDVARYFFIYVVLSWAAQSGVDLATKIPIEQETWTCTSSKPDSCTSYRQMLDRIGAKTLEFALLVAAPSSGGGGAVLEEFEHFYEADQNVGPTAENNGISGYRADAGVIRPGEKIRRVSDGVEFDHPTRPFSAGRGVTTGWPGEGQSWGAVLEVHPVLVRAEVLFNPIFPMLPNLHIGSTQMGFRRPKVYGSGLPPIPFCGNKIKEGSEECDDGPTGSPTCTTACRLNVCGDGYKGAGEQCDPGNDPNCTAKCTRKNECGNQVLEAGEECDVGADGNPPDCGICMNNCQCNRCGNGIVDAGEQCDPNAPLPQGCVRCYSTCMCELCGNGNVDPGEECDDGNSSNNDACLNSCKRAKCGDGYIQHGQEECDSTSDCTPQCKKNVCGDGFVGPGEQCDDGNKNNNDGCSNNCKLPGSCGNGIVDPGEECDDGNSSNNDECLNNCKFPNRCGNGRVEEGEECDDGNAIDTDGCVNCRVAVCGDGYVRAGVEQCDDGNTNDDDDCLNNCKLPNRCGNGKVEPGEECDDGNTNNSDGCTNACKFPVCGDGIIQAGEECDGGPNCTPECKINKCGDGYRLGNEECDDGNTNDDDGCLNNCTLANKCGNGKVEAGEECDDGNTSNTDSCIACVAAKCGDGFIWTGHEECDPPDGKNCVECKLNRCLGCPGDLTFSATQRAQAHEFCQTDANYCNSCNMRGCVCGDCPTMTN